MSVSFVKWRPSLERRERWLLGMGLWSIASFPVVFLAPSLLRFRTAPWLLPAGGEVQAWTWGLVYVAVTIAISPFVQRRRILLTPVTAVVVLGWAAGWTILTARADFPVSRMLGGLSALVGTASALLPVLLGEQLLIGSAIIALAGGATIATLSRTDAFDTVRNTRRRTVNSALVPLSLVRYSGLVPSQDINGGGIVAVGNDLLLATRVGQLYRISGPPRAIRLQRLAVEPPMSTTVDLEWPSPRPLMRLTGLVAQKLERGLRVIAAHERWIVPEGCVVIQVSVAELSTPLSDTSTVTPWRRLYSSTPCSPPDSAFAQIRTGGAIALRPDGSLLLSVGDYGHDGVLAPPSSQDPTDDRGKVLVIDSLGRRSVFSTGHRNTLGLAIDGSGGIWESEHGPQGGDEINLLRPGRNYGWPWVTHGTQYGSYSWPLTVPDTSKAVLVPPVMAFVPSVGIAGLHVVRGVLFPQWTGDLLAAALRGRAVYRLRLDGDRIVYAERIAVDQRVRSVTETDDGRLFLWTDDEEVIEITPDEQVEAGALVYLACSGCHGLDGRGTAEGPPLLQIYGSRIASDTFPYSNALRRLGGRWTEDRLDAFLSDPAGFAPGTAMAFEGITDSRSRQALIAYLSR